MTICPEWKTNGEKFNFTEILQKDQMNKTLNDEEQTVLELLAQICSINEVQSKNITTARENYIEDFRDVKIYLDNMDLPFYFGNSRYKMKDYFKEILTDAGFCYTFNMLAHDDLFTDDLTKYYNFPKNPFSDWDIFGYKTDEAMTYPLRVAGSGAQSGLHFKSSLRREDEDQSCNQFSGFRIALHTPDEMPKLLTDYHHIEVGHSTLIKVNPRKSSTSERLRSYKPEQRECYFKGEKSLQFFKHYNLENCKLECNASE